MSSHRAKRQKKGKTAPPPVPMVPPPSNMEKDSAQALAEMLSGPGVARPINMDKALVNVPRTPPVGGVANMAPVVDVPPTSPVGCVANMAPVVDPLIPGHGQTIPRSVSFTRQHHLNVA